VCWYGLAHGSGGEARRSKTQCRRQQAAGECKERGSESASTSKSRAIIISGGRLAQMPLISRY
jgi:hypothetical protein